MIRITEIDCLGREYPTVVADQVLSCEPYEVVIVREKELIHSFQLTDGSIRVIRAEGSITMEYEADAAD